MRAYIIDTKEQDISYIPLNSFVYNDGCGFIKRKQTTAHWSDTDFERIYCTDNETLNPVIADPSKAVTLKGAEVVKFVIHGAYDFDKGATITSLAFKDILGNELPWDMTNVEDLNLSESSNWELTDDFEGENLFNGNKTYNTIIDGPISSTIFNKGIDNYGSDSSFYIRLPAEKMELIDGIEIIAGSPDGRIPISISVYAVRNKGVVETEVETLVFFKSFSNEIDGNRPAQSFRATQNVRADNPCLELFRNGLTEDGINLVMNPYTGKLTTIYCEFPDFIEYMDPNDPGFNDYMTDLCSKNPESQIISKDIDGGLYQVSLKDFFVEKDWVCYKDGCSQLSGNEYSACMEDLCVSNTRNPQTTVIDYDRNLNETRKTVQEYLILNNYVCNTISTPVFADDKTDEEIISTLDDLIADEYKELITVLNPATGETVQLTPLEYKTLLVSQDDQLTSMLKDGWVEIESDLDCSIKLTKDGEDDVYLKKPNCAGEVTVYNNTSDSNDGVGEIDVTDYNLDLNNLTIMDSEKALKYKIVRETRAIPKVDIDGNPIVGDGAGTFLKEFTKIVFTDVNTDMNGDSISTLVSISDGSNEVSLDLNIRNNYFNIFEAFSFNDTFTVPLLDKDEGKFKKCFEYDEPGALIKFYAETNPIQITGYSDKILVEVVNGINRDGVIKIRPNILPTEITMGFQSEVLTISSGDISYDLEIIISKHIRFGADDKSMIKNIGVVLLENGDVEYELANIDSVNATSMHSGEMHSYLVRNGSSKNNYVAKHLDDYTGACVQRGANSSVTNNSFIVSPYQQQMNEREFYILDPFFNEENVKLGIIEPEQQNTLIVKYEVNRFMEVNGSKNPHIFIDKYRFINSYHGFNYFVTNKLGWQRYEAKYFRDMKLKWQTLGLSAEIGNKNIIGLGNGSAYGSEDLYFDCKYGQEKPKIFTILTDERYTEIGTTDITFTDIESSMVVQVTVQQFIDVNLPFNSNTMKHELFPAAVGSEASIQLLHPFDNNWDNIVFWTDDDTIVEGSINKSNKTVDLIFNKIGSTNIYVSDRRRSLKISVVSESTSNFGCEYRTFKMRDDNIEWHTLNLVNVEGTVSLLDGFNTDFIEVELVDNNSFRFRNISGTPNNTVIRLSNATNVGDTFTEITIQSISSENWFDSELLKDEFNWYIDDSEVFFEIENTNVGEQ